jgi:Carboxypeptidase regulatory-like domain
MNRIGKICFLVTIASVIFLSSSSRLFAQATANGSIIGKVTDSSGATVPNVLVMVTSPQLQVPQVTTTSDAEGNYKVLDLPAPGVYHVAFSATGFRTFVQEGLNLSVGFAARIDAVMQVGAVWQTVSVTGASPVVDTVNTAGQTTIPGEEVQNIPRGANLQEMEPMVTGLNLEGKPDVGDSNFAARATTLTYGVPLSTTLGVEGIDNTDDKFANSSIYLNFYAVQEAEFKTSGNNADVAFPGVDQVIVLKSGANTFHGSVRGDYENPSFQSNNLNAALAGPPSNLKNTNPLEKVGYYDYAADLGGFIIRDKLWFYGGFSRQYVSQGDVGYVGGPGPLTGAGACGPVVAWIASECPSVRLATIFSNLPEYNGKGSYQLNPSIRVLGTYMWDAKYIPNQNGTPFLGLPTSLNEDLPSWTWKAEVQVVRPKWLLDIIGGAGDAHPGYTQQLASNIAKYGYTKGSGFAGDPSQEDLFNQLFTALAIRSSVTSTIAMN